MDASAKRPGSERARKLVPLAVSTLVAVVLVGVTVWSLGQDGETVPPERTRHANPGGGAV